MFIDLSDDHVAAVGAGHGAADQEQVVLHIDAHDLEVARRASARCPYRPAMRLPLNTRAGNVFMPVPPAWRCTFFTPWVARWP